jgi:hypothetical protein
MLFSTANGKWILTEVYIVKNRKSKYIASNKRNANFKSNLI